MEQVSICMMRSMQQFAMLVALTRKVGGRWKNIMARIMANMHAKKVAEQ